MFASPPPMSQSIQTPYGVNGRNAVSQTQLVSDEKKTTDWQIGPIDGSGSVTQADAALPSSGRVVLAPIVSEASHFPPFSPVVAQIPVRGPREAAPQPTGDESPLSPLVPTPMPIHLSS